MEEPNGPQFRPIPNLSSISSNELRSLQGGPSQTLQLGFVNLKGEPSSSAGMQYEVISAADKQVGALPIASGPLRIDLTLLKFFTGDLPDFWGRNEGMLRILANTRVPQDLTQPDKTAGFVTRFEAPDHQYAPGFLYPGVFRNVTIDGFLRLQVQLHELDTDAGVYFDKVKTVVDGVPELKNLDIVRSVPYLDVALKLGDGLIKTFGKNPDDYLWGEVPLLEADPSPDAPFLRTGIYVLFQTERAIDWASLTYYDGSLQMEGTVFPGTHMIFTLKAQAAPTN